MKILVILFFLSLLSLNIGSSAFALPFVIDLETDVAELDIDVSTYQTGTTAIVALENHTQQTVNCQAMFHNGPEVPIKRKKSVEKSEKIILSYTADRPVIRMRIQVRCVPVSVK